MIRARGRPALQPGERHAANERAAPSLQDRLEAALSVALQDNGVSVGENQWQRLCHTFEKEFFRRIDHARK